LSDLIQKLRSTEADYVDKLEQLFEDAFSEKKYKNYAKYIVEITDKLEGAYGITNYQFFQLAMLNLSQYQFERILSGHIAEPEKTTHTVKSICENPYLLFEEYKSVEANISESTGLSKV